MDQNESVQLLGLAASLRHLHLEVRTIERVTPLPPVTGRCHRCGCPCKFVVASFCDDCLALLVDEPDAVRASD
jgi:hypothetical protein